VCRNNLQQRSCLQLPLGWHSYRALLGRCPPLRPLRTGVTPLVTPPHSMRVTQQSVAPPAQAQQPQQHQKEQQQMVLVVGR
jgi:hypothetical protein